MNYYFAYFFLNPALAIDLGATSILECLVERKEVSPNSSSSCGITRFFGVGHAQPLILSALIHEDSSAFKYLLSRPDFVVESNYRGQHPLNFLRYLKSCFRGKMPLPDIPELLRRLRTLVRKAEDFEWNPDSRLNAKGTPLCMSFCLAARTTMQLTIPMTMLMWLWWIYIFRLGQRISGPCVYFRIRRGTREQSTCCFLPRRRMKGTLSCAIMHQHNIN